MTLVAYNEDGRRCGQTHHNSTIPDAVVNRLRDMHEDEHVGYKKLAKLFGLHRDTVRKLCTYTRRADVPREWREVKQQTSSSAEEKRYT
jgi:hypothetical protein